MFAFNELQQIHLEITNNCQARCPMCSRNIHGGLENPNIKVNGWTFEQYKNIITQEVMDQVDRIYFCGNYGDPLLNNDLLDMIKYTTKSKPTIHLAVHTNGSLRNSDWWKELAQSMPENHSVVFAIDGLEDTHELYRIGTQFDKIIQNAKSFIDAGGKAEWHYIRFKHNEHQVEQAKQMAKDFNFETFVMKDSSRWIAEPSFPVFDKQGNTKYNLEKSQYSEIKILDKSLIENYKLVLSSTRIDCHALKIKEVYIDSYGHLFPCCWLASIPYQAPERVETIAHIRKEIQDQYNSLVESFGGIDQLNTNKKTIKDIVDSKEYQTVWNYYWNEAKMIMCGRICGVHPEKFSQPDDQFITREKLEC